MIQLNSLEGLEQILQVDSGCDVKSVVIIADMYLSNEAGAIRIHVPYQMYHQLHEFLKRTSLKYIQEDPVKPEEPARELHTCPYKEEINNDYETLCDCDEEQMHECRMDI